MAAVDENEWQIRILFDAECPLCLREGRALERLDGGRGRIQLEDLSSADFDPARYGLDQESVEARIHGILPDGTVIEGVEVFARAYAAVGLGWLARLYRWGFARWLLDGIYGIFARNRLRITGRGADRCALGGDGSTCRKQSSERSP